MATATMKRPVHTRGTVNRTDMASLLVERVAKRPYGWWQDCSVGSCEEISIESHDSRVGVHLRINNKAHNWSAHLKRQDMKT
jgi:hypothetical protein